MTPQFLTPFINFQFKIMCFTHDDPAGDANLKLDKIATEIDSIGKKLNRMEMATTGSDPAPQILPVGIILACVNQFNQELNP